jgi:hypothetical protein
MTTNGIAFDGSHLTGNNRFSEILLNFTGQRPFAITTNHNHYNART